MHRTLVALAFAASFLSTTPAAGFFDPLWNALTHDWAENGCAADPDGRCQPDPGTSSITVDLGCTVDPNGRCIG